MSELKEKQLWYLPLQVSPELKSEVVRKCKELGVRRPVLVSALIERVFDNPGILEYFLENSELPKRYQRTSGSSSTGQSEVRTRHRFGGVEGEAHVGTPKTSSESQSRPDPKQLIERSLQLKVNKQPEINQPAEETPKKGPSVNPNSNVVPIKPEMRRTSWEQLCEMTRLPGENLDEEVDALQRRWEERWGEPSEEELDLMISAAEARRQVYAQWREKFAELIEAVQQAKLDTVDQHGRSLRVARRKLISAQGDLKVFKTRTRWDERRLSEKPPWEQG